MYNTYHLEKDMERYTSMSDQELMANVSHAHEILSESTISRQRELARRVLAHIEFEVIQRLEDGE